MSTDDDLHAKLLSFLAGEFARKDSRQCVRVDLLYAPGKGFRNEEIRRWAQDDDPCFGEFDHVEKLVSSIIEIAEGEADCRSRGSRRFIVRTRQHFGDHANMSFMLSPTHNGERIEDEDKERALMKCLGCEKPMNARVEDFDYSRLAGLRGVTVTLRDVTLHQCEGCGPKSMFVEICRIADLTRELEAAGTIHVKQLWCSFRDDEWSIAIATTSAPQIPRKPRRGKD